MAFTDGYALLIGVDTYANDRGLLAPQLKADAEILEDVLCSPQYGGYLENQVKVLTGANATRANILAALDNLVQQAKGRTILLLYSGHGVDGDDGSYHLTTADVRLTTQKPRRVIAGTGISQQELLQKLQAIETKRLLLIFNACHSEYLAESTLADGDTEQPIGKNPPDETINAILGTGEGRIMITACRPSQSSFFLTSADQTIFGKTLIDLLKGQQVAGQQVQLQRGYVSALDLYTTLYFAVADEVKRLVNTQFLQSHGGTQEPTLTVREGVGPFAVALCGGATTLGAIDINEQPPATSAVRIVTTTESQRALTRILNIQQGVGIRGDMTGGTIRQDNRATSGGLSTDDNAIFNAPVLGSMSGGFYQPGWNVSGNVYQAEGDMLVAGRDINQGADALAKLFSDIGGKIKALPADQQEELKPAVEQVRMQIDKVQRGDETEAAQSTLGRRLKNLRSMAPDIGDLIIATLANPAPGIAMVIQKIAVLGGTPPQSMKQPERTSRYTNYHFYREVGFSRVEMVPREHTLEAGAWYYLAVSINNSSSGIPAVNTSGLEVRPQPLPEPEQAQTVDLMVTVHANDTDFEIGQTTQNLKLPPIGDSEQVFFRVKPKRETTTAETRSVLRVRIYYRCNLLEEVNIEVEVAGLNEDTTHSKFASLPNPISFRYGRKGRIDPEHMSPRGMHIEISCDGNLYQFTFKFSHGGDVPVEFVGKAPARVNANNLEDQLVRMRKTLLSIVMHPMYTSALRSDDWEFARQMQQLAKMGRRLWRALFGGKRSAMAAIGEWLKEHPLPNESVIQISVDQQADTFVFPWNLIYDAEGEIPDGGGKLPDLNGFWGMRYIIEQLVPVWDINSPVLIGSDQADDLIPTLPSVAVNLCTFPFPQTEEQIKFFQESFHGDHRVTVSDGADTSKELLRNCTSHVLYFFAHGYTRHRNADIGVLDHGELLKYVKQMQEQAGKDQKPAWEKLSRELEQAQYQPDDSYLKLAKGKLFLEDLEDNIKLYNRPIVFLNTCDSAQITPSLGDSFIDLFIKNGASCVIGTECHMVSLFADKFSRLFFQSLIAGASVGYSLLHARRICMEQHNPLGLVYTLFGSALVRFDPALITAAQG